MATPTGTAAALGKIAPAFFRDAIAPHLGAARPEVLAGPRAGHDAAIVRIGAGRVMAVTTDPLSLVPAWGPARSARIACHLIASDLWTTGIPPAYASVSFALPPGLDDGTFGRYWRAMSDEWAALGVAVVTGHTGRYPGCDLSIVGACTLVGVGDEGRYVTPAMASPGDRVIVTKGCAIETTAVAAHLFPQRMLRHTDEDGLARARAWADRVSVVADCRAALRVGVRERGVTALHDATEGGVLGGLLELAQGAGCDLRVERARIPLAPEAEAACAAFGIDPWWALSQGTLVVAARADRAAAVLEAIREEGIEAAEVGEVVRGDGALWLTLPDGRVERIAAPQPDPYWAAYDRAVREAWT
uniref:AIR synthase n=1 Tax=Eiseniibacteriota bacterium TaxID=2212470 RepID=A0A832MN01_UNCEI